MRNYWIVKNMQVVRVTVVTVHPNGRVIVGPVFPADIVTHGKAFPWPKLQLLDRYVAFQALEKLLTQQLSTLEAQIDALQTRYVDVRTQRDLAAMRAERDKLRNVDL